MTDSMYIGLNQFWNYCIYILVKKLNSTHLFKHCCISFLLPSLLATTNDSIVVYHMTLLSKLVKVSWKANVGICCYKFQTSICIVHTTFIPYIQTEVHSTLWVRLCGLLLYISGLENIVMSSKYIKTQQSQNARVTLYTVFWWRHIILEFWKYIVSEYQRATHS